MVMALAKLLITAITFCPLAYGAAIRPYKNFFTSKGIFTDAENGLDYELLSIDDRVSPLSYAYNTPTGSSLRAANNTMLIGNTGILESPRVQPAENISLLDTQEGQTEGNASILEPRRAQPEAWTDCFRFDPDRWGYMVSGCGGEHTPDSWWNEHNPNTTDMVIDQLVRGALFTGHDVQNYPRSRCVNTNSGRGLCVSWSVPVTEYLNPEKAGKIIERMQYCIRRWDHRSTHVITHTPTGERLAICLSDRPQGCGSKACASDAVDAPVVMVDGKIKDERNPNLP